jgi:diaminopimelate epimerase
MSTITFTKHHGLGNDFLIVFHPDPSLDLAAIARRLCDRKRGVGADGLLIGESEQGYAARMVLYNADGSRAAMSGNGIRCFAQALADRRGDLTDQRILTDAGERTVSLRATEDPWTIEARVDMGVIEEIGPPAGWAAVGAHSDRPVAHVCVGNPHTVVGVDDVHAVDLAVIGAAIPDVNLEVVEPGSGPGELRMRVHERGAGITEACGTGACAAAWAARRWGLVADGTPELMVHMDGGAARVALDQPAPGRVTLTGPATYVATIEVPN